MRIIAVLLAILILLTSCAKEEQIIQPPVTPPVIPPVQPPIQPEQPPVQPPVTPPVTPPVVEPTPPGIVSNLPVCDIIGKIGHVYSEASIGGTYIPGQQITNEQSEDLSVCYPYFLKTAATTASVCCII